MAFTRTTAIQYLAGNPNFQPSKPLTNYSTNQLLRYARAYQAAEQAGRADFTQLEARGHLAAPVQNNPRTSEGRLEEHKIEPVLYGPTDNKQQSTLTVGDLRRLLRKARLQDRNNFFVIKGYVSYRGYTQSQTLAQYISQSALEGWLRDHKNNYEDLTGFAAFVTGVADWERIEAVGVSYPEKIKGVQRQ
jgi:hypothetical protein